MRSLFSITTAILHHIVSVVTIYDTKTDPFTTTHLFTSQYWCSPWNASSYVSSRLNDTSKLTLSQCSMNSAKLSRVWVISGISCTANACSILRTSSSCCDSLSSVQHDTNAALNRSLQSYTSIMIHF